MGTWGTGILQDDLASDIRGHFDDCLKKGMDLRLATESTMKQFAESFTDEEEQTVAWFSLAERQWRYGGVERSVLERLRILVHSSSDNARWKQSAPKLAKQRQRVLKTSLAKFAKPNPRPSKPPKIIVRPPPFSVGDCLAIKFSNGFYGAALVLASNHSDIENGLNLVATLDYFSQQRPELRMFKKRRWMRFTQGEWRGRKDIAWFLPHRFEQNKQRIEVVGRIKRRLFDPVDSTIYGGWESLGSSLSLKYPTGAT